MSDERKDSRLPPPAFPPGTRRQPHRNSAAPPDEARPEGLEGGAFISPDDPIPARTDRVTQAFISPDDPIPSRSSSDRTRGPIDGAIISPDDPLPPRDEDSEEEEGVVTGMGFDAHVEPGELVTGGDPYVIEVVEAVRKLADSLNRKGEAGLRASPAMSRFEATLRAYCVGYLAGRRAEEELERSEIGSRVQPKAEPPDF